MAMMFDDGFPMAPEVEAGMDPRFVSPVMVAFGMMPMKDEKKTLEEGREVYVDVEHVKIAIPGDRNSLYLQPATDSHRRRFPKAYEAFKNRNVEVKEGLPLEHWAPLPKSMVLTFKAAHVHTVEALAAIHEGHIDKFGFVARKWRDMAKAHLESAKDSAHALKVEEEKRQLQEKLRVMSEQIAALTAKNAEPEADEGASARKARKS
jgi:hypothetical protein